MQNTQSLCFNALPRAFFFSTEYKKPGNKKFNHVSMPYLGLSSFLQLYQLISTRIQLRFNALPRAFFFSTMSAKMYDSVNKVMFQCPTSGFLLFYRLYGIMNNYQVLLFQCPTSGFLLFYNYTMVYNANNVIVVSMPYLGLSSFLLRNSESVK